MKADKMQFQQLSANRQVFCQVYESFQQYIRDVIRKILLVWIGCRSREMVANERWSHMEIRLQ